MIYYVGLLPFDSDLAHHGIKNQKWGRRRYQNKDGSLTSLGYEHYYGKNGISKDAQRRREKKRKVNLLSPQQTMGINHLVLQQILEEKKEKSSKNAETTTVYETQYVTKKYKWKKGSSPKNQH